MHVAKIICPQCGKPNELTGKQTEGVCSCGHRLVVAPRTRDPMPAVWWLLVALLPNVLFLIFQDRRVAVLLIVLNILLSVIGSFGFISRCSNGKPRPISSLFLAVFFIFLNFGVAIFVG